MRVFLQFCFNSSLVHCVAAKFWPTPPQLLLLPCLEAALLDRQQHPSPLRANPPAKKVKRRTKKKIKRVRKRNILSLFFFFFLCVGFHIHWFTYSGDGASSQEDQLCMALVNQLNKFADKETLIQFLRCFLLESNSSAVRWQAHCLTLHIYRYFGGHTCNQNALLSVTILLT